MHTLKEQCNCVIAVQPPPTQYHYLFTQAGLIIAGWDHVDGANVWAIPLGGTLMNVPYAIGGSGNEKGHDETVPGRSHIFRHMCVCVCECVCVCVCVCVCAVESSASRQAAPEKAFGYCNCMVPPMHTNTQLRHVTTCTHVHPHIRTLTHVTTCTHAQGLFTFTAFVISTGAQTCLKLMPRTLWYML